MWYDDDYDPYGTTYSESFATDPYSDYDPMYAGPESEGWKEHLYENMPRTGWESWAEDSACMVAIQNFHQLRRMGMLPRMECYRLIMGRKQMWATSREGRFHAAAECKWLAILDRAPNKPKAWLEASRQAEVEFQEWLDRARSAR